MENLEYKLVLLDTLRSAYERLREIKIKEQNHYKSYYDRSHKPKQFKLGYKVWVHFHLPKVGKTHKVLPSFEGPFQVTQQIDKVTYRVANADKTFLVHVQRLLPYHQWQE